MELVATMRQTKMQWVEIRVTINFSVFSVLFTSVDVPSDLLDCRLAVVEGLVCFYDPESLAGGGGASGRYNQTGKINWEISDQRAVTKSIFSLITYSLCSSQ